MAHSLPGGAGAHFVDPDVYRANLNYASKDYEIIAVTVDLQINGKWDFYYQHQRTGSTKGNICYDTFGITKIR